jgi:predicted esterase
MVCFFLNGCGQDRGYQVVDSPHPVVDRWGNPRTYRLYMPRSGTQAPLMVYFHGVMSDGFQNIPTLRGYTGSPVEETGLIEFCRRQGIILLVPRPVYRYSFLNQEATGWLPFEKEMDGIEKMIDLVVGKYPVSRQDIFLAGISAGAGMCHHLANHRPGFYSAILSHSQGYVDAGSHLLEPAVEGPQFGVVFCYTRGDYPDLIRICQESEKIYRRFGYRTVMLKNLSPENHSWDKESNRRFWRYLQKVKRSAVDVPGQRQAFGEN